MTLDPLGDSYNPFPAAPTLPLLQQAKPPVAPAAPAPVRAAQPTSPALPAPVSPYDRNKAWLNTGPQVYNTPLNPQQEQQFRAWLQQNNVPFEPDKAVTDYDMRGFWLGMQQGDEHARNAVNPNDHKLHYSDYWKTPYHKTFSAESRFADPTKAPKWNDKDQLVMPDGSVIFDERAKNQPQSQSGGASSADQFAKLTRAHESGGNDVIVNKETGATGRYQFLPQTWEGVIKQHPELGLTSQDIYSGAKQDIAMRAISQDYARVLTQQDLDPSMPNMFMLHFMGEGAGPKFLKSMQSTPNANAAALFPLEAKYNPRIFTDEHGQPRTLSQVYALMTKTFGGNPVAAAREANPPPVQVAEGPATTMTDAGGTAAAIPDDIKAMLKPAPVSGAAEIPDDIKAMLKPAPAMTGANPYASDSSAPEKPKTFQELMAEQIKSDTPTTEQEAIDRGADQASEQTLATLKGIPAGAAENITGLGEWIPGPVGSASAAGTRYLESVGSPGGRMLGNLAPMALPFGWGAEGVKAAATGVSEAGEVLPWAQRMLQAMKPAAIGTGAGATQATGIEDQGERLKQKAWNTAKGFATGVAAGEVAPAAIATWNAGKFAVDKAVKPVVKPVVDFVKRAYGKEAAKLAEELKTGVDARTGAELTEKGEAAKAAGLKHEALKTEAAELEKNSAEEEKRILEGHRSKVGGEIHAAISFEDKSAQTAALNKIAAERNAAKVEAEAAGQERKAAEAEADKEAVVESYKDRQRAKDDTLGKQAGDIARPMLQKLKQERLEKSGVNEAVNADKGKPSVSTVKERSAVDAALKDTSNKDPKLRSALTRVKHQLGEPADTGELRDQIGKSKKVIEAFKRDAASGDRPDAPLATGKRMIAEHEAKIKDAEAKIAAAKPVEAVSIRGARQILQGLRKDTEAAYKEGRTDAAKVLERVHDDLKANLYETHPKLEQSLAAYAQASRGPLDAFRTGPLGKAAEQDLFSGEPEIDPTKIEKALLNQTTDGVEGVRLLVKQEPEFANAIKEFYNKNLFGSADAPKDPGLSRLREFYNKNERTLKAAGLDKEYKTLLDEREAVENTAKTEKDSAQRMNKAVAPSQREVQKHAAAQEAAEKAKRDLERHMVDLRTAQPRAVPGQATTAAKALQSRQHIGTSRLEEVQSGEEATKSRISEMDKAKETKKKDIEDIAKRKVDVEKAHARLDKLKANLEEANTTPRVTKAAKEILNEMYPDEVRGTEYRERLREIQKVEDTEADHQKAKAKIVKIMVGAGAAAATGLGVGWFGNLFSHRVDISR